MRIDDIRDEAKHWFRQCLALQEANAPPVDVAAAEAVLDTTRDALIDAELNEGIAEILAQTIER